MNEIVELLRGKLIVSCQAFHNSPMYGTQFITAMALSAEQGGAGAVRVCWADNIRAVKAVCKLPVIGINKVTDSSVMRPDKVYITPTFEAAAEVIEAGCDILGMDFTPRMRNYADIEALVKKIRKAYPCVPIMADISTLDEGIMAAQMGADIVSTTLSGYTLDSIQQLQADTSALLEEYKKTGEIPEFEPDYALIDALKNRINVPINAEGRFWERNDVVNGFRAGADMVTVGTAITAPEAITKRFVHAINEFYEQKP
jgi:N-acylglucosamine-6-phosphate 2-epimerase